LSFRVPESPVWLIKRSQITNAHKALEWYRGDALLVSKPCTLSINL
jgi:hypothetical protein